GRREAGQMSKGVEENKRYDELPAPGEAPPLLHRSTESPSLIPPSFEGDRTMKRIAAALLLLLGSALAAEAQSIPGNPVADAARAIGRGGLKDGEAPKTSPTAFKPDGTRRVVAACAKQLGEDDAQRKAYEEIFLKLLESYEKSIAQAGTANDAAGTLAFAVAVVYAGAREAELDDQAYLALVPRLQATFDVPAVRNATDAQKQECYEWALCAAGTVLAMAQLAETPEAKAGVKKLARA